ncbi:MAG: glucose-6-phosphate dehydrogenase [Ignavibacteria bacterium RBG_16_34_14]|nr:MAG: glucose-6-phosphate dehydrogenase [Ignavibacteria bacterium RBG_16_34_14]
MKNPENQVLVIFGASGDLTYRKLIPSIYDLYIQDLLPERFAILGVSRTNFSDENFREKIGEGIKTFANYKNGDVTALHEFLSKLYYFSINTEDYNEYIKLDLRINELNKELETGGNCIYYLSTPPSLYPVIPQALGNAGMSRNSKTNWKRLIVEKPFGYDIESAKELNKKLLKYFDENQIYRIDHYLGKETVQNVFVTRFANGIFEPLWNRNYIHHVEITGVENIGVENRGGYYDSSGALRDMLQNHLLQITSLIAMEPPSSFDPDSIRNETIKVFQSLRPLKEEDINKSVIRGQYLSSTIKGEKVPGYREEKGVNPLSKTETYVALKLFIDNWRWGGVPFYIRTGKRLPTRVTEVVIHFKPTPHYLFARKSLQDGCNQLVIRIQPDEGILLKFGMKVPGSGFNVQNVNMDFHYSDLMDQYLPSAYERLLYDCMLGDSTLYQRGDAAEAAWTFVTPILEAWKNNSNIPVHGYPAGTWGPENADDIIEEKQFTWRYPCKNLVNDGLYCEL